MRRKVSLLTKLVLGAGALFCAGEAKAYQITLGPGNFENPSVSNGMVAFEGESGDGNKDIYVWSQTDGVTRLTFNSRNQIQPAFADPFVAYTTQENGNFDIRWLNLETNVNQLITSHPSSQKNPDISLQGDVARVIWQSWENGNWDIKMAQGGVVQQITTDPFAQINPSTDGNITAWTDTRNGNGNICTVTNNCDVRAYDHSTGEEFVVANSGSTEIDPFVSDGRIFYSRYDGNHWNVWKWEDGETIQLTNGNYAELVTSAGGEFYGLIDYRYGTGRASVRSLSGEEIQLGSDIYTSGGVDIDRGVAAWHEILPEGKQIFVRLDVPETGTLALLAGGAGLALKRRRKETKRAA